MAVINEIVADLALTQHDGRPGLRAVESQLYVDTSDVRRAILGANEYISHRHGDKKLIVDTRDFDKPAVLVAALLASYLLGPFAMLPPHQAEILRMLKDHEAFDRDKKQANRDAFLDAIGIDRKWGSDITSRLDDRTLREALLEQAGPKTEQFFKAVQFIRFAWWEQLKRLRDDEIFIPFTEKLNYAELLQSRELPRLEAAFAARRGRVLRTLSKNNFADAISLLVLIELTRRCKEGRAKMPRFFDSTGLFTEVALDVGVMDMLTLTEGGISSCALVSHEALVTSASLRAGENQKAREVIDQMQDAAAEIRKAVPNAMQLDDIAVQRRNQPLGSQWREFVNLSFLENVWLKTMAVDDLKDVATQWVEPEVLSIGFRQQVEKTIDESVEDVLTGAAEYKRYSEAWSHLLAKVLALRRRRREPRHEHLGLFMPGGAMEMGIFRFCVDRNTKALVRDTLENLCEETIADEAVTNKTTWHYFIRCTTDLEQYDQKEITAVARQEIEFAASALWAIEANELIVDFLKPVAQTGVSFLATTIHTAALLQTSENLESAEAATRRLSEEVAALTKRLAVDDGTKGSAGDWDVMVQASGVAYLWFHHWLDWHLSAWWRVAKEDAPTQKRRIAALPYLRRAVDHADLAWEHAQLVAERTEFGDLDFRERRLYVLNQRLYYLTELGDPTRAEDMVHASEQLLQFQDMKNLWRATYWDTLARFFALRAFEADNRDSWQEFIDMALGHQERAMKHSSDPVIDVFNTYLKTTRANGFKRRVGTETV